MIDYGMYSEAANEAIASMVTTAQAIRYVGGDDAQLDFIRSVFSTLSHAGHAECWDTAVRERICAELEIPLFYS